MRAKPRFSIVIPTYNRAASVELTLAGCFAQKFVDFEIIVVDDGSTDETTAVLAGIDDPRLRVVRQDNAGPAAARNRGMQSARGAYIAFLDSDDIWYPEFLESASQALAEQQDMLLYGQIIVDRGVGRYWVKPDRPLQATESIYDYLYIHGGFIQTSTMVIPRSLAQKVWWDESVTFGDNDQFAIDCWRTGIRFHMLVKPMTLYADVMSSDALSQLPLFQGTSEKYTNFFAWMSTQRNAMSKQAWAAYRGRFESVALARTAPVESIKLVVQAWRTGAMGFAGMGRQLLQNFTPRLYRRLIDQYVRLRGAPLDQLKP